MNYLASFLCLILIAACSNSGSIIPEIPFINEKEEPEDTVKGPQLTDKQLYEQGLNQLDRRAYRSAVMSFEEIERLYPFSKLATQSHIMIAYAKYRDEQYDEAVGIIDRFVKLHPAHHDVDYMYYLKAMSYYERIADVKRDQKITLQALDALDIVAQRFPESQYSRDAKLKKDLVVDHLAGKEMEIGRFYLKRRQFVGAINRFQRVVDNFQTTNHIEEALYRLVEAHLSLGLLDEAKKYAAVLGQNYPNSKWYKYAYRLVKLGEDSPKPNQDKTWYETLTLPFVGDDESYQPEPLEQDDQTDSWLEKIRNALD